MVQGRPVVAFRIVAAAGQQPVHQGRPIGGECQGIPQVVAGFSQPAQHQGRTGWGVQAHPIGQAPIAVGVIGQHQGQATLRHRGLAQLHPGAGQLGDPGQPFLIGAKPLQRGQQATAAAGRFFERPHAGDDAAIQFGQGHLQAQVQGTKANAAVLPALTGPGARKHLQHRHPQPLPQGRPQPRLLKAHRSKARGAEHRLDPFTAEPIGHPLLHRRFPQAAHPKRPGYQALLAQGPQGRPHEGQVARLHQRAIQQHPHPGPVLLLPIVALRIVARDHQGHRRLLTGQQGVPAAQHLTQIRRSPLTPTTAQSHGQGQRQGTESRQLLLLFRRARHDQQMAAAASALLGDPALQPFEAIAPVPPTAPQPHGHQLSTGKTAADVVVDGGRVAEGRQRQGPYLPGEPLGFGGQQAIKGRQVRGGTAQKNHGSWGLFDQPPQFRSGEEVPRDSGKAMHGPILQCAMRRSSDRLPVPCISSFPMPGSVAAVFPSSKPRFR